MISFTGTAVGYFEPVIDNIGVFVDGFLRTLQIVLYAVAGSLLLGSVIAAFRVSPIPPLRWVGTSWVTVFRLPIALLDLVARGLGVDPERTSFKPLPAGSREAALERGEVDLVAGGYEITDQRRSEVTFAGPYLINPPGETRYGFGLPVGDDVLRDRVQAVLREVVADGTWTRLYAEHLGTPVPDPPPLGR